MKIIFKILILVALVNFSCTKEDKLEYPAPNPVVKEQIKYEQDGFVLNWKSDVTSFSAEIKKNMVETFFKTYPKMIAEFGSNATKTVTIKIVPVAMIGSNEYPAYTSGNEMVYGANYMGNNANDWDIVTHESFHVMQNGYQYVGWLSEGIADYVRYIYGVHNVTGWKQSFLNEKAVDYKGGYGKTGRFLLWIEKNVKPGVVKLLNDELRKNSYNEATTWNTVAGSTLDVLANNYKVSPNTNMP